MDGKDQPVASQISEMDTTLDHSQEVADASGGMGSDSDEALQAQGGVCKGNSIH